MRPESLITGKIVPRADLAHEMVAHRETGKTLAFANGLFDLLHVGHLRYLEAAAHEADLLLVAVNSDRSARALKGPPHPLVPEAERALMVAAFACVDFVTVFDDLTVEPLLHSLRPDVHCKGTDYTADTVPERQTAAALGIRIAIVGDSKDHASSRLITLVDSIRRRG